MTTEIEDLGWDSQTVKILPGSTLEFVDSKSNKIIKVKVLESFEVASPLTTRIKIEYLETLGIKHG